ncbi:MAG: hypothetical protein ACR2OO_05365 [Thermomicrobiales bacterium]
MRIELFIGDGWTPFALEENEDLAFTPERPEEIDVEASTRRLAELLEARVREVWPKGEVVVSAQAAGEGLLSEVGFDDGDLANLGDLVALTAADLEDPAEVAPLIVAGEIEGLLDGIVQEQPHTWRVER